MIWILYLVANLFMLLLAYLLAPFLPVFAFGSDHFPEWLSWFDTPDNALDGDDSFKANHAPFRGDVSGWRKYVNRIVWLWRNPSYGFDIDMLGFVFANTSTRQVWGNRTVSGDNKIDGWYSAVVTNHDGSRAWQLFAVKHLTATHCARLNLGWKLWGWKESEQGVAQFVFSMSPWKEF